MNDVSIGVSAGSLASVLAEKDTESSIASIAFEKYFDILKNNKLLIAGFIALTLALGLAAALLATPQYRATARIQISAAEQNITNVQSVQDNSVLTDRAYLPTQYELLESNSLAMRVVRTLDLRNDDEFLEAFEIAPGEVADLDEELVETLFDNVEIDPITDSFLVDVKFSSPSPTLSARLANAWTAAFIEEDLSRKYGATTEAREFLEERLAQTRERLELAERELIAYATDEGLLTLETDQGQADSSSTASQTLVATELAAFNGALNQAVAARVAAELALSARTGATAESNEAFANGVLAQLRARRSELQIELAEVTSRFEDEYPPVQALRAQLAQIESAIASEQGLTLDRLRADYREALAEEQRLQARVSQLEGQLIVQRQDSVQYNILQREVDTNRQLYAGLLQRFREIGVVGVGESNVLVVDPARPPKLAYSPSIPTNLAVALLTSLIVIATGVYLYDMLNQSLRNPQQVRERFGLELLGSIPRTEQENIMVDLSSSYTDLYESYFTLTASIANANGGVAPRSMMVTSSRPGEGKSLSALALAYLFSRQGKRVLLLDCDLRKSGVGKYIGDESPRGTTQYLMGDDDWRSMVTQPEAIEGCDVLSAGRKSLQVAELLANGRFQQLLDEVENDYDHVVIDGPPVLGLVDAPLIAAYMGGVILIIEANKGKWRFIERAIMRLKHSNARLLGAAVTKLDERNATYGYGDAYGYGYGYGSSTYPEGAEDERKA